MDEMLKNSLALFNEGKYYDSHHILEELWLSTNDLHKSLYQGIIQSAVALHLLDKNRLEGAYKMFNKAINNLEKHGSHALGIDIYSLINDMKACFNNPNNLKNKSSTNHRRYPKIKFVLS